VRKVRAMRRVVNELVSEVRLPVPLKGACGNHVMGQALATRMLSTRADLPHREATERKVAAGRIGASPGNRRRQV